MLQASVEPRQDQPTLDRGNRGAETDYTIGMYADEGCRYAPSCLTCHLPRCAYDGFRVHVATPVDAGTGVPKARRPRPPHVPHALVQHVQGMKRRRRGRVMALTVRLLVQRDQLSAGTQTQVAEVFAVSRQRVHQLATKERVHTGEATR